MIMTTKDHGLHELGFLQENQSWDFSNDEIFEKLHIELSNQEEGNEGDRPTNEKRSRENASRNGKKVDGGEGKHEKSSECDHEKNMWSERERRKKMGSMIATLHALLPKLPSKVNKSTIIDETISYIESLKHTLEKLEKQKQERLQSVFTTFGVQSSMINSQWYPNDDSKEMTIANHGSFNNFTIANGNSNTSNSTILSVPRELLVAFETWSSSNLVLNICGNEAQFCILATRKPGIFTTIALVLEKHQIDVISASILGNGNGNRYMILAQANETSYQLSPQTNSVGEIYKLAAKEIMRWIS